MSTIKSQISTITCDSRVRTESRQSYHLESTYCDDSIDNDDDKVCDGRHDSGDDVANGRDNGALELISVNRSLKTQRCSPLWKELTDS